MKDIIKFAGDMNEPGHIMMIKFKLFELEQVLNIPEITRDQIIHGNHLVAFANKPVAKMRTQETGASGNQNPFAHCTSFG